MVRNSLMVRRGEGEEGDASTSTTGPGTSCLWLPASPAETGLRKSTHPSHVYPRPREPIKTTSGCWNRRPRIGQCFG